jgi:hemerythrin-like domain-containing protein
MTTPLQTDTVMDYLQTDHRRLDGLMDAASRAATEGRAADAAASFFEFRVGLTRHIKIEEGLLFPAFEEATGMPRQGGPTGVMHLEHEEILRMLGEMGELFEAPILDVAAFESLRGALVALLHDHNGKEERVLYPMTDRMMPLKRLHELVDQMRAFR